MWSFEILLKHLILDFVSALEQEIAIQLLLQLNAAWTPQYCKKYGIVKFGSVIAVQAPNNKFSPQKLNIPYMARLQDTQG